MPDTAHRAESRLRSPRSEKPNRPTCTDPRTRPLVLRGHIVDDVRPASHDVPDHAAPGAALEFGDELRRESGRVRRERLARDARRRSPNGRSCCPCRPTAEPSTPTRRSRAAVGGTPASGAMLPKPARSRFGSRHPADRARDVAERVAAHVAVVARRPGAAPMPTPSSTMIAARRVIRYASTYRRGSRPRRPVSTSYGLRSPIAATSFDVDSIVAVGADERRDVADRARRYRSRRSSSCPS